MKILKTVNGAAAAEKHAIAVRAPKRVFLVDPFLGCRMASAKWIQETPDLVLCGQAARTARALRAIGRLKPDVVVTEILSQQDFDLIQTLRRRQPNLPILVFSFRDEECYAPRILEAGADGFLGKEAGEAGLVSAIRAALEGRMVLSPHTRARLLAKCLKPGPGTRTRRPMSVKWHHSPSEPHDIHALEHPLSRFPVLMEFAGRFRR